MDFKRIIISRTDSIGDVMLTLPLCGLLKKEHPHAEILFLGSRYTRAVIETSANVDTFIDYTAIQNLPPAQQVKVLKALQADGIVHVFPRKEIARLAKQAGIPIRIGTTNRLYHWASCNKLVSLSRKRSPLHESQLNIMLAKHLLKQTSYATDELWQYYGFTKVLPLQEKWHNAIDNTRFNLIIHPKSKGSAREWPLEKYAELIKFLPAEHFNIFISGTADEGSLLKDWLKNLDHKVTDITGQMNLPEFISFINACDGLISASTGPLHIAAALGKYALGIYPPIKPMHPGRWKPIGEKAAYVCFDKPDCQQCKKQPQACACIQSISVSAIKEKVMGWSR